MPSISTTPQSSFAVATSPDTEPSRGRTLKRKADAVQEEKERKTQQWRERKARSQFSNDSDEMNAKPQNPMSGRVILAPTPPSTILSRSRSRSSSPVRQTIKSLARGVLAVKLISPTDAQPLPKLVLELRRALVIDATVGTMPEGIRDQFREQDARTYEETIKQRAQACLVKLKDENAWCDVVNAVLTSVLDLNNLHQDLEVNNIQSQSLDPQYLPRVCNSGRLDVVNKKSDFALAMTRHIMNPTDLPLSAMADAYTSTVPIACPIEVNRHGGSAEEAELQLMVALSAGLSHLQHLRHLGDPSVDVKLPLMVGCAVIGHYWSFYIAWKDISADGAITVMGPLSPANAGTADITSMFVLLKIWTKLVQCFDDIWLCNHFFDLIEAAVKATRESTAE
ncbi:hypothetical protein E4T42_04697 [Aureobasidium subglaciale]|nr:hypothetical protein E4T42_04697 [Aureobasidium subglaciale]